MLEPPPIPEPVLIEAVVAHYALEPLTLTFLPLGADAATWVYRLTVAHREPLFLKLRRGPANVASFRVPRFLADQAHAGIMAALPAGGELWVDLDGYNLALYPYIDGVSGASARMNERQWRAYGASVRALHDAALPEDVAGLLRHESFAPGWRQRVQQLDAAIAGLTAPGEVGDVFVPAWRRRREVIERLVGRSVDLARRLHRSRLPMVTCHADIHTWNLLVDPSGQVWVVDWDEVMLAPKECDLLFVVGGIGAGLVSAEQERWFFQGYGETVVNPLALAYYRHERAISDLVAYAEQIVSAADTGDANQRFALDQFHRCFAAGNIVDLAGDAVRALS